MDAECVDLKRVVQRRREWKLDDDHLGGDMGQVIYQTFGILDFASMYLPTDAATPLAAIHPPGRV
jgi:hypothetical protein